ncbi:ABC transporter substrate-binding protein [Fictibacillus sp. KU28468]|uniref:ABC transporter substrate-binding protein n=1 Tax=Fictibacillus sp. KU28468 TaxID=2991053 RepID=UPI00223D1E6A|nr:ABC transporter substrate-binding protein [Fictibacillus sp. KU28468]UZJ78088.1 ABC transporter substrate-binding protein [Fictibacillus sp. KU28468]
MKIFPAILFSILLMLGILAGCSGSSGGPQAESAGSKGKVTVNFWTFWGSETRRPVIEKIISDFNKSQDDIYVKHTFLPWGDIWTKNLAAISAGNPPDVIINDINSVQHRAKNNQSTNLTKYIKDDSFKENFYPRLWDTVLYKGDPYAVPFNTDTRLLFYNKKAFKEAGLDPNKPPKTWDELESYAKRLDKKSGDRYERIGFYPLWGSFGPPSWLMNADNGESFLTKAGQVQINSPEKIEGLKWLKGWNNRLGTDNVNAFKAEFGSEQANPFIAGKVGMWVDVGTFYTQIRDFGKNMDFGVAPIPSKSKDTGHWSDGGGFVAEIPKGAAHPKEAYKFIKYLTGEKAQSYWASKNFDNVSNKKASEDALSKLKGKDKMVYRETVKNLNVTKMNPVPPDAPDYQNKINPLIDEVLLGKKDPEKALKQAQSEVEHSLQN